MAGHVKNITQVVYIEKLSLPKLSGDLDQLKVIELCNLIVLPSFYNID